MSPRYLELRLVVDELWVVKDTPQGGLVGVHLTLRQVLPVVCSREGI